MSESISSNKELSFDGKLVAIQNELKVPKSQYSEYGNYNYRSFEDILQAAKPLNQKYGLRLTLTDEPFFIEGRFYIKATAILTDGVEKIKTTAYAREAEVKTKMDPSQVTGSASSYARKYALNGLYLIDDAKDVDALPLDGLGPDVKKEFTESFNHYIQEISVISGTAKEIIAANTLGKHGFDSLNQVTDEFYSEIIGYLKVSYTRAKQKNSQPKQQTQKPKKKNVSWGDL